MTSSDAVETSKVTRNKNWKTDSVGLPNLHLIDCLLHPALVFEVLINLDEKLHTE